MLPRFSFASSILQPKHQPIYKSLSISGPFQSEPKSRNLFPVTSQPALFTSSCFLTIANCCLEKNFFGRFLNNSTICLSVPSFMPSFFLSGSFITFLIGSQPMNQPVGSSWKESGSDQKMTSIPDLPPGRGWSLVTLENVFVCLPPLLTTKSPERKPRGSLKEIYTSIINRKCTAYLFLITFPCNDDDDNPM